MKTDYFMLNVHGIARELGKFAWEVLEQMPPDEFVRWLAYFEITAPKEKA